MIQTEEPIALPEGPLLANTSLKIPLHPSPGASSESAETESLGLPLLYLG